MSHIILLLTKLFCATDEKTFFPALCLLVWVGVSSSPAKKEKQISEKKKSKLERRRIERGPGYKAARKLKEKQEKERIRTSSTAKSKRSTTIAEDNCDPTVNIPCSSTQLSIVIFGLALKA